MQNLKINTYIASRMDFRGLEWAVHNQHYSLQYKYNSEHKCSNVHTQTKIFIPVLHQLKPKSEAKQQREN